MSTSQMSAGDNNRLQLRPFTPEAVMSNIQKLTEMSSQINNDYWTLDHYLANLNMKWELSSLVYLNDVLCGFIIVSAKDSSLHVNRIVVARGYQGNGIGKLLIDKAIDDVRRLGKQILTLKVDSSSISAINFYKKNKFSIVGKQEDLLLMELKISA